MAIATKQIAQSNHDASQVQNTSVSINRANLQHNGNAAIIGLIFDFTDEPTLKGATINSAELGVNIVDTSVDSPNLNTVGEAADTPSAFAASNNNLSSRATTSADVSWIATNIGAGEQHHPDLSSVIQELVDRPGFSGIICLLLRCLTESPQFAITAWDGNPSSSAGLEIDFTPASSGRAASATLEQDEQTGVGVAAVIVGAESGGEQESALNASAVSAIDASAGLLQSNHLSAAAGAAISANAELHSENRGNGVLTVNIDVSAQGFAASGVAAIATSVIDVSAALSQRDTLDAEIGVAIEASAGGRVYSAINAATGTARDAGASGKVASILTASGVGLISAASGRAQDSNAIASAAKIAIDAIAQGGIVNALSAAASGAIDAAAGLAQDANKLNSFVVVGGGVTASAALEQAENTITVTANLALGAVAGLRQTANSINVVGAAAIASVAGLQQSGNTLLAVAGSEHAPRQVGATLEQDNNTVNTLALARIDNQAVGLIAGAMQAGAQSAISAAAQNTIVNELTATMHRAVVAQSELAQDANAVSAVASTIIIEAIIKSFIFGPGASGRMSGAGKAGIVGGPPVSGKIT